MKAAIISFRNLKNQRSRALMFEREDFLSKHFSVDIIAPRAEDLPSAISRRIYHRLSPISPKISQFMTKNLKTVLKAYDLLVLHCMSFGDLDTFRDYILSASSTKIVCSFDELWPHNIDRQVYERNLLNQCFAVVTACYHAAQHLKTNYDYNNVHYLQPSVDTIACYAANRASVNRVIDLYYMGRRIENRHAKFMQWSQQSGVFYFYDTAGNVPMIDHQQHRRRYLDILNRTKLFVVSPGKIINPDAKQLPEEIGYRYFEAAACGAIMIGDLPNSPVFKNTFNYRDAVIPIPADNDLSCFLDEFANPKIFDFARIRTSGYLNMLTYHDHVHWWNNLLHYTGFPYDNRANQRIEQLNILIGKLRNKSSTGSN